MHVYPWEFGNSALAHLEFMAVLQMSELLRFRSSFISYAPISVYFKAILFDPQKLQNIHKGIVLEKEETLV